MILIKGTIGLTVLGETENFHSSMPNDDKPIVAYVRSCFTVSVLDPVVEHVVLQVRDPQKEEKDGPSRRKDDKRKEEPKSEAKCGGSPVMARLESKDNEPHRGLVKAGGQKLPPDPLDFERMLAQER